MHKSYIESFTGNYTLTFIHFIHFIIMLFFIEYVLIRHTAQISRFPALLIGTTLFTLGHALEWFISYTDYGDSMIIWWK